jgi:3-deoxy-D-manno-octulosonic-acid transferase
MALAGLFARMGQQWPQAHFLITTTARTSGEALQKSGLPPRCTHQFAPVDVPKVVSRFLNHWQPALAVWCEMDLWPALIDATTQRHIAHVLVNARLDANSLRKRRWGRWIYSALLPGFTAIWVQNEESRLGLMALGASAEQMSVTGTIKNLAPPLGCDLAELQAWQQSLGDRPIWLLASSHPGEETLALSAHQQLLRHQPDALLIIAPRARDRGLEVTKTCPSSCRLRSAHEPLEATTSVYVADTIGEMGLWYRLAPIALMGGSFAEVGGHNPHEPLALDCRVLHGPNVWNFSESYADLDDQGLALNVSSSTDIAQAVLAEWARSPTRTQASGPENQALVSTLIRLAQRR